MRPTSSSGQIGEEGHKEDGYQQGKAQEEELSTRKRSVGIAEQASAATTIRMLNTPTKTGHSGGNVLAAPR